MKTTLTIDDSVMARLKRESARTGRTMSELVETALRRLLQSRPEPVELHRSRRSGAAAPWSTSRTARPCIARWTGADVRRRHQRAGVCGRRKCARARALPRTRRGLAAAQRRVVPHVGRVLRVPAGGDASPRDASSLAEWRRVALPRRPVGITRPRRPGADRSRHSRVLAEVVAEVPGLSGNIVHDTQTAVLMREHGIRRICTRDTDFHRFPFLEPIDPLRRSPEQACSVSRKRPERWRIRQARGRRAQAFSRSISSTYDCIAASFDVPFRPAHASYLAWPTKSNMPGPVAGHVSCGRLLEQGVDLQQGVVVGTCGQLFGRVGRGFESGCKVRHVSTLPSSSSLPWAPRPRMRPGPRPSA